MQRKSLGVLTFFLTWIMVGASTPFAVVAQEPMPPRQEPWTVSSVQESPDPPLPYKASRIFQNVQVDRPTDVSWVASANKWMAVQHGGKMQFGPDGMLYFAVGDGQRPYPPDANNTGQDSSDLQASIMRINVDVSEPDSEQLYRIAAVGQQAADLLAFLSAQTKVDPSDEPIETNWMSKTVGEIQERRHR